MAMNISPQELNQQFYKMEAPSPAQSQQGNLPQQQSESTQSPQPLHSMSSSNSTSPAPSQIFSERTSSHGSIPMLSAQASAQDVLKCAHFFKSLLKLRPQQSYNIQDLKNLLREVLLGEQTPEEFTVKLREVTKSQDKGNLLPFLKRALPALRHSIQEGEYQELLQAALDLDDASPALVSTPIPSQGTGQSHQIIFVAPKQTGTNFVSQQQQPNVESTGNGNSEPAMINSTDSLQNLPQMLLNPQALADRILAHIPDAEGVDPEVLSTISNAAEVRLRAILAHLAILAEHRLEPLRINPMYQIVDEPRKQLRFMEDIDKRAHESRQTAEKEALLKITKSKGKDKDTLEKAKQLQKADREAMVNREANAAAFAALGGRGSRGVGTKRPFAANAGTDWKNGLQNQGLGAGLAGSNRAARIKRVTMRDLQFFLGNDPAIPHNSRLRHRIALASLSSVDENTSF